MNEIQLSTGLVESATKINSHKNNIGYSFIEIGKELIRAKEEDVNHGEWHLFLNEINMSKSQADRHIKISNEHKVGKLPNVGNIGFTAMYEIATLPEEQRSKAVNEDGTSKTVDEIRIMKRELKNKNSQLKQSRESEQIAIKQLEEEQSKEPQVIREEVVKEIIPEHIKQQMTERDKEIFETKENLSNTKIELDFLKRQQSYKSDEDKNEQELKALRYDSEKTVLTTKLRMDEFLKDVAVTPFRKGAIASASQGTQDKLSQGVEEIEDFCKEMRIALSGRIEIKNWEEAK